MAVLRPPDPAAAMASKEIRPKWIPRNRRRGGDMNLVNHAPEKLGYRERYIWYAPAVEAWVAGAAGVVASAAQLTAGSDEKDSRGKEKSEKERQRVGG